ncbi:MAG: chalcone isomerase family protein [Candidatus Cloacimonetes bacterium]|nr:chalcone isomerase family protein [Candidatus Cloacimonadota bacterium]
MKKVIILTLIFVTFSSIMSLEIAGVSFLENQEFVENKLVLNGAGLRKKFVIKVYACGLYLKEKNNNIDEIINSDVPMAIKMHFLYKNVPKEKLISAWNKGFEHYKNKKILVKEIARFNSFFKYDAHKNDIYEFVYTPRKGVDVIFNDELIGTVGGIEFKKALFSIWLGEKTNLPKLKAKLLGN